MRVHLTALLAFLCSLSVSAQTNSRCNGVLELAGKDLRSRTTVLTTAESLREKFCSGSSLNEGIDLSVPLAALVEGLPTDLVGTFSGRREKMQNLCQTFDTWKTISYKGDEASSLAVRESITAWSNCMRYSDADINVQSSLESLIVSVSRGREEGDFHGVVVSNNTMSCRTRMMLDGRMVDVDASVPTHFPIKLSSSEVNVTCIRTPTVDKSTGDKTFAPVELSILTTRGKLLLPIPWDKQFSAKTATEMTTLLKDLRARLSSAEARLSKVGSANKSERTSDHWMGSYAHQSWDRDFNCPDGQYVSGIKAHGRIGFVALTPHGRGEKDFPTIGLLRINCMPIVSSK